MPVALPAEGICPPAQTLGAQAAAVLVHHVGSGRLQFGDLLVEVEHLKPALLENLTRNCGELVAWT